MDKIDKIITESINKVVNEKIGYYREPLLEMARVGYLNGQLEVYVKTKDGGSIPHVHVRDTNTQGRLFETCIELGRNMYFLHGKYDQMLTKKQCQRFNEFMHEEIHTRTFNGTVYEFAVDMWNYNNSHVNIEVEYDANDKPIIPNYDIIVPNK